MMDGVDLDVAQARADLLPDKYDRRRISQALAIRRLSSRHYKRPMNEGSVCSGWMLLLLLVCSLHHIYSKYWQSFKRRHPLLVCFVSLPVALCWKASKKFWKELGLSDVLYACFISLPVALHWKASQIGQKLWKEFMELDAVCDGVMMLGLYWEVIFELWLFLKRHWLTTEIHILYIELDEARPRRVVGSKVTKKPVIHVMYEMILCYVTGWAWFRSLLVGPYHLVIRQLLIISGDVELNPGPLDDHKTVEEILETIDNTVLGVEDWNIIVIECKSLSAKWEQLSIYLGLSFEVTDNIKGSGDNYHCWSEALKYWIRQNYNTQKFGMPSWRSLLAAVVKVDKLQFKDLASKHLVQESHHPEQIETSATPVRDTESKGAEGGTPDTPEQGKAPSSPTTATKNTLNESLGELDHQVKSPECGEGGAQSEVAVGTSNISTKAAVKFFESGLLESVSVKPCLTFPFLKLESPRKHQEEQLHQRLFAESERMIYKFNELFKATRISLLERKIPVGEMLKHLDCLGSIQPIFKGSGLPVLGCQLPELRKTESIDSAMSVISNYCSFFNYHIVEEIINNLGTEQDKANLKKYKDEFSNYAHRHVIECPSELGEMNEIGHANMFVTLDAMYDSYTISHLYAFVSNLQTVLKIPAVSLRLCRIGPGSLKLIFQLPHSVWKDIFPLSPTQEASLADLGVVELSCGDYQFNRLVVEDPCASDGGDSDYADSDAELVSMATGLTLRDTPSICADSALTVERSSYTGTSAVVTVATEDIWHRPDLDDPDMGMGHDSNGSELHLASYRGDLETVKFLTEEKQLNPLHEDKGGRNAIYHAAKGGQLGVLKYFIEELGHNPASQCSTGRLAGWTPLHVAAQFNHLELVQYLVAEQQVDPMCQANDGSTPLHKACHRDNIDVVIYLAKAMSKYLSLKDVAGCRGRDGQTPLHSAALFGQLKVVKYFITELNCDPNIVQTGELHGRPTKGGGRIALHDAAQKGHLHVVKFLIEDQHCDPSHCDYVKVTPLHMAAQSGHLAVVQYLTLEQHCDPLCTSNKNNTPLHLAANCGHLQVVKFLIETLHCPPDIRGWRNMTPLEQTRIYGYHHVVKYLESVSNPK